MEIINTQINILKESKEQNKIAEEGAPELTHI